MFVLGIPSTRDLLVILDHLVQLVTLVTKETLVMKEQRASLDHQE